MSIHSELLKKVNEHLAEYGTKLPTELHNQIVHDMLIVDEAIKILDAKVVKDLPKSFKVSKSDYDWLQMNRPLGLPGR